MAVNVMHEREPSISSLGAEAWTHLRSQNCMVQTCLLSGSQKAHSGLFTKSSTSPPEDGGYMVFQVLLQFLSDPGFELVELDAHAARMLAPGSFHHISYLPEHFDRLITILKRKHHMDFPANGERFFFHQEYRFGARRSGLSG